MKNLFLFFLLVLLLVGIVTPVSADITLHFVDRSFFGTNPVTITDYNGTLVFNGTTSSIATISNNDTIASYWISFQPGGITDIARDPDYGAAEGFGFAEKFGVGIFIVIFIGIVWFWRTQK